VLKKMLYLHYELQIVVDSIEKNRYYKKNIIALPVNNVIIFLIISQFICCHYLCQAYNFCWQGTSNLVYEFLFTKIQVRIETIII